MIREPPAIVQLMGLTRRAGAKLKVRIIILELVNTVTASNSGKTSKNTAGSEAGFVQSINNEMSKMLARLSAPSFLAVLISAPCSFFQFEIIKIAGTVNPL